MHDLKHVGRDPRPRAGIHLVREGAFAFGDQLRLAPLIAGHELERLRTGIEMVAAHLGACTQERATISGHYADRT
ncbi:hypothetical protein Amme_099_010 [Acidomonas methanolica NBRC 104435]|uniref:Uncharacterized protein n=1 Tax=Acidomonas methanolica NBRC 104435 TaxID=1231351 RepID=A0A023D8H8_ACIMT|nr:hypothetical protein Amme_099_010 [Acidomonas methanolica NBRC 104435]GEK97858.1 hypothetical protein AME01nite_03570 [Acidomonas methanolica NBRC 104435]